jgi:AraC-like DNA-binding protein
MTTKRAAKKIKRPAGGIRSLAAFEKAMTAALPEVRAMGLMQFDPIWAERWHQSGNCELLHVTRGTVRMELPGEVFEAGPGDTLLLPAGALHRDRFDPGKGLEIFFCTFDWAKAKPYFSAVSNEDLAELSEQQRTEIGFLFEPLRTDRGGLSAGDRLMTGARLLAVLLMIFRVAENRRRPHPAAAGDTSTAKARRQELLRQAKAHLNRHYARPMTLDDIAEALRVSPYHLSHVFSQESEFSLFAYLTLLRMNKAKALLREGRWAVAEVARAVGYEDAGYFAKVFHKHAGVAPRDFAVRRL